MRVPERSPERDAALDALLPLAGHRGWTMAALQGVAGPDADLLFPGGPAEMVEAYCDLADRWMAEDVAAYDMSGLRVPERVALVIAARLKRNAPFKAAVGRGLALLALPAHGGAGLRCIGRTVDAVWEAAGDEATGFSWYSKRATLAAVYSQVLLYWLRDESEGDADTLGFLHRLLGAVGQVGRLRRRLGGRFSR